jgi:hypothetical protein
MMRRMRRRRRRGREAHASRATRERGRVSRRAHARVRLYVLLRAWRWRECVWRRMRRERQGRRMRRRSVGCTCRIAGIRWRRIKRRASCRRWWWWMIHGRTPAEIAPCSRRTRRRTRPLVAVRWRWRRRRHSRNILCTRGRISHRALQVPRRRRSHDRPSNIRSIRHPHPRHRGLRRHGSVRHGDRHKRVPGRELAGRHSCGNVGGNHPVRIVRTRSRLQRRGSHWRPALPESSRRECLGRGRRWREMMDLRGSRSHTVNPCPLVVGRRRSKAIRHNAQWILHRHGGFRRNSIFKLDLVGRRRHRRRHNIVDSFEGILRLVAHARLFGRLRPHALDVRIDDRNRA